MKLIIPLTVRPSKQEIPLLPLQTILFVHPMDLVSKTSTAVSTEFPSRIHPLLDHLAPFRALLPVLQLDHPWRMNSKKILWKMRLSMDILDM